jgi:hypothetical protein
MSRARDVAKQGGLVQVIPTSIAVGSGSGSVAANGKITFTSVSSLTINGCFTSVYDNYLFELRYLQNTATGNHYWQTSLSGTPAATNYGGNGVSAYANNLSGNLFVTGAGAYSGTKLGIGNLGAGSPGIITATVSNPALAEMTLYIANHYLQGTGAGGNTTGFIGGVHTTATAYDGMYLSTDAGTLTGTVRIYGYNNGA